MAVDVVSAGIILKLSSIVGTSEPALRLLISIFFGYPLALFHRKYLYGQKGLSQHIFFIITGIAIGYFNYGCEILHPLSAILYTYLITTLLNGNLLSLQIAFVANFGHLLLGYYLTGTDDYDIKWTMPHCVLVLRLVGYAFNIYDGSQAETELSNENKLVCLKKAPNFIEYCGFMCFPASFLVGPQFPYKRYEDFVNGVYRDSKDENARPDCITPAVHRMLMGVIYLVLFQIGSMLFTEDFLVSDEFDDMSFVKRIFYLAFWGKVQLYKYVSCWLVTEGALIMFGLSYNGKDENGISQWNGCENVRVFLFENTTEFTQYVHSFNINTNQWVGQYIYKRLKFLGNRLVSQFSALAFLAVWHGFHSGYYICFLMEFLIVYFEKDLKSVLARNEKIAIFFKQPGVSHVWDIFLRIYAFVFMGWCMVPFVLLKFPKYWKVFGSVYHMGFVIFALWPIVYKPIVKLIVGSSRKKSEKSEEKIE